LFNTIIKRVQAVPTLSVSMVFDYSRSQREDHGDSSVDMMNHYLS
jgi:hypothetical protein